MKAFISHETALAYWRQHYPLYEQLGSPSRVKAAEAHAALKKDVLACVPEQYFVPGRPVDVLVTSAEHRRPSNAVTCHIQDAHIPAGAFYRERDVCVSSPEYLFLQMARTLSVAQLVALGCELCGTYVLLPQGVRHPSALDDYPERVTPLTNIGKLRRFLEKSKGASGQAKALRALRHVVEGSRSPMETVTYLLLCLPPMLGGYGLPKPYMNPEIELDEESRTIANRSTCFGDICWPGRKLDIEYHSELHVGGGKMKDDVGRTLGIEHMGWRVLTVTSQQVLDIEAFDVVAKGIAKHIKHRLYPRVLGVTDARQRLHQELEDWMFL